MKSKTLLTLLGGMLTANFAMAFTTVPDYSLVTSDNLVGQYSVYDSGFYNSNGSDWLGQSAYTYNTTANALGAAYQDAGQWYRLTEFVTTASYSQSYQNYTQNRRDISLSTPAQVTDSFIDLTVNTSSPMSYNVYAYGVNGSTTSPRGFTQTVNPSLGLAVDGQQVALNTYSSVQVGYNSWQSWQSGVVSNTFQAVAEASGGSFITSMSVALTGDKVLGAISTQNYSYESNRFTQAVTISAPVPEPETYAMMLAGLGLMGAVARRRKQKQA